MFVACGRNLYIESYPHFDVVTTRECKPDDLLRHVLLLERESGLKMEVMNKDSEFQLRSVYVVYRPSFPSSCT